MVIRQQQIRELSESRRRKFEDDVIGILREEFPERCVLTPEANLRANIHALAVQCAQYGITDENSIAKYVYLTWLLGDRFEDAPGNHWLGSLIRDLRRPGPDRMEIAIAGVVHHLENETGALQIDE